MKLNYVLLRNDFMIFLICLEKMGTLLLAVNVKNLQLKA